MHYIFFLVLLMSVSLIWEEMSYFRTCSIDIDSYNDPLQTLANKRLRGRRDQLIGTLYNIYIYIMIDALTRYADDLTALLALGGEIAQFEYLIDIGRNAPKFSEQQRIKKNKMFGCLAQVWIIQREAGDVFYYQGDSDAAIVKGLIIIITEAMSGHTREEIASIKHHVVNDLGLGSGLTARRQVGMMAMIDYIKRKSGSK